MLDGGMEAREVRTLIVGLGEVGGALHEVLSKKYEVWSKDIADEYTEPSGSKTKETPQGIEIIHVCIRYSEDFLGVVRGYIDTHCPRAIDVCTTVPPGTTRHLGPFAVHSTTRGLHPNLSDSLTTFVKHIGGPVSYDIARYFGRAGVKAVAYNRPETTELAHILYNAQYGINLMFADEMQKLCRVYGVDYMETVLDYTATGNKGFKKLDHESKSRMMLWPPGGRIGGHCVVQGAKLLPQELRGPLLERLARFNDGGAVEGVVPGVPVVQGSNSPPIRKRETEESDVFVPGLRSGKWIEGA